MTRLYRITPPSLHPLAEYSNVSGSIRSDNPPNKKKWTLRRDPTVPENVASFEPIEIRVMDTDYIEPETLEENDTRLFKVTFYDKDAKKAGTMKAPYTFFNIQQKEECHKVLNNVRLDNYFVLPPWGIDVQRSYDLIMTIDKDGVAKLTNKEGEEFQVRIIRR